MENTTNMIAQEHSANLTEESRQELQPDVWNQVPGHPPEDGKTNEEETEESKDKLVESTEKDEFQEVPLNPELQQGFRILKELMAEGNKSVNWPFLDPVDSSQPETADYYEKIKKPIWLHQIKEKFDKREYEKITEFVADFRVMLENCYRYNGPDHYVSKRGQRLETMMEQKLALLPRELRQKTTVAATSGQSYAKCYSSLGLRRRGKSLAPHDSSALLNQLRAEEAMRGKELRKQMLQEKKAAQEAYVNELIDWEDTLLTEPIKTQMRSMWELPQIGHFLFLCQIALNVGEVIQFELERCFAMPRESSTLQWVMTCLMSTPFQRTKLDRKSMMPYVVWEEKVRTKLKQWYKMLEDNNKDSDKVAIKLGLDPFFFKVLGQKNPLERRKYHELSYFRRVWIVKSICDHLLETQEYLRDAIEAQPIEEQRDYFLGTDGDGNDYLHFPQFCGADVRIYRRSPIPLIKFDRPLTSHLEPEREMKVKHPPRKKKKKTMKMKKTKQALPTRPQRPSRLRQNIKTVLPQLDPESESSSEESDESEIVEAPANIQTSDSDYTPSFKRCPRETTNLTTNCDTFSESGSSINDSSVKARSNKRTRRGRLLQKVVSRNLNKKLLSQKKSKTDTRSEVQCNEDTMQSENENLNNSSDSSETIAYSDNMSGCSDWDEKSTSIITEVTDTDNVSSQLTKNTDNVDSFLGATDSDRGTPLGSLMSDLSNDKMDFNDNSLDSMFDDTKPFNFRTCLQKHSLFNKSPQLDEDGSCSNCIANGDIDSKISGESGNTAGLANLCTNSHDIKKYKHDEISESMAVSNEYLNLESAEVTTENLSGFSKTHSSCLKNENMEYESRKSPHNSGMTIMYDTLNHQQGVENSQGKADHFSVNARCVKTTEINSKRTAQHTDCEMPEGYPKQRIVENIDNGTEDSLSCNDVQENSNCDMRDNEKLKIEKPENTTSVSNFSPMNRNYHELKNGIKNCGNTFTEDSKFFAMEIKPLGNAGEGKDISQDDSCSVVLKNEKLEEGVSGVIKMESSENDFCEHKAESSEHRSLNEKKSEKEDVKDKEIEIKKEKVDNQLKEEEVEEEEEEEISPEIGDFELIVDSVESLRQLLEKFAEPDATITKSRIQKTKSPRRKKCVSDLYARLEYLLKELEPWETKLVQAAKKARIKLRKEKESYKEEKPEDAEAWKTDDSSSNSSDSTSEDSESDSDSVEKEKVVEKNMKKKEATTVKEEVNDVEEEIDISLRGRLRRKRVIPNNVADLENAKKRKTVKKAEPEIPVHVPNILQKQVKTSNVNSYYGTLLTSLGQLSSLQSTKGSVMSNTPILIQTNQGPAVVTGLSCQTLANLQMQSKGISQQKGSSPRLASHPLLQPIPGTSKHSAHPVMQQLLTRGSSVKSTNQKTASVNQHPLLQQTETANQTSASRQVPSNIGQTVTTKMIGQQAGIQIITTGLPQTSQKAVSQGPTVLNTSTSQKVQPANQNPPVITPQTVTLQKPKMQYYATNLQSLPQNVLQQLLRNQAVRIQTGGNQAGYVILNNAAQATIAGSTPTAVTLNMSTVTTPASVVASSVLRTMMSPGVLPASGSKYLPGSTQVPMAQTHLILPNSGDRIQVENAYQPLQNSKPPIIQSYLNQPKTENRVEQNIIPTTVHLSDDSSVVNQTSAVMSPGNTHSLAEMAIPSVCSCDTSPGSVITSASLTTEVSLVSSQTKQISLAITDHMTSAVTTISKSAPSLSKLSVTSPGYIPATSPGKQMCKYANNVTVKTLLEARKSIEEISGNKSPLPSPGLPQQSNIIPANFVTQSSNLQQPSAVKPVVTMANIILPLSPSINNSNATSYHTMTDTVSTIQLPSKATLDSAVKSVFTSVRTSLPTANIKVPSPSTMPSINPRRNVTKTIQSMKAPITVTPKLVSKLAAPIETSGGVISHTGVSSVDTVSAHTISLPGSSSSALLSLQGQGQKGAVMKVVPQQFISPQGVLQGILTSQGIVIPQSALQKAQHSRTATATTQGPVTFPAMSTHLQTSSSSAGNTTDQAFRTTNLNQILLAQSSVSTGIVVKTGNNDNRTAVGLGQENGVPIQGLTSDLRTLVTPMQQPAFTPPSHPTPSTQIVSYNLTTSAPIFSQAKSDSTALLTSTVKLALPKSVSNPIMVREGTTSVGTPMMMLPSSLPQNTMASQIIRPANRQAFIVPTTAVKQASDLIKQYVGNQTQTSQPLQIRYVLTSPAAQATRSVLPGIQPGLASSVQSKHAPLHQLSTQAPLIQRYLPSQVVLSPSKPTSNIVGVVSPGKRAGGSFVTSGQAMQLSTGITLNQHMTKELITSIGGDLASLSSTTSITDSKKPVVLHARTEVTSSQAMDLPVAFNRNQMNQSSVNSTIASASHLHTQTNVSVKPQSISSNPMKPGSLASNRNVHHTQQFVDQKVVARDNSQNAPVTAKQGTQRLVLYSIGGQLVTAQGVPVTVDNGVMKILPEAKVQIANQSLILQAPQNTETENHSFLQLNKATSSPISSTAPSSYENSHVKHSLELGLKMQSALPQNAGIQSHIELDKKSLKGNLPGTILTKNVTNPIQIMTPKSGSAELLAKMGQLYATGQNQVGAKSSQTVAKQSPVLSNLIAQAQPSTSQVCSLPKEDAVMTDAKHGYVVATQLQMKPNVKSVHPDILQTAFKLDPLTSTLKQIQSPQKVCVTKNPTSRETVVTLGETRNVAQLSDHRILVKPAASSGNATHSVVNSKTLSKLGQLITNPQTLSQLVPDKATGQLSLNHVKQAESSKSLPVPSQQLRSALNSHNANTTPFKTTVSFTTIPKQHERTVAGPVSGSQSNLLIAKQSNAVLQNILSQQLVGQPSVAQISNVSGQVLQADNIVDQSSVRPVLNLAQNQQYLQLIQNPVLMNSNVVNNQQIGILKSPAAQSNTNFVMVPQLSGQPQVMLASGTLPTTARVTENESAQIVNPLPLSKPECSPHLGGQDTALKAAVQHLIQSPQNSRTQNEAIMKSQMIPNQVVISGETIIPHSVNLVHMNNSNMNKIPGARDVQQGSKPNLLDKQEAALNLLTLATQFVNTGDNIPKESESGIDYEKR
ncbi:hypothetical protein ScPMuIL_016550 [Solemya velum]